MSSDERNDASAGGSIEERLRSARDAAEPEHPAAGLAVLQHRLFAGTAPVAEHKQSGTGRLARFELRRVLGRGAMGIVYEAWDPDLARTVALKRLIAQPERGAVPAVERLRREARAMARLDHPHVLRVYEVGEVQGEPFVAMEYAALGTLARWLEQSRTASEVVDALLQAGRGLSAAHRAGLVHRDVKPSNVLRGADSSFKIGDFGLVSRGSSEASTEHTQSAVPTQQTCGTLGTPAYMAPEVWAGEPADAAADQYSFCVVLYEALYGQRPFAGRPERGVSPPARTHDGRRVPAPLRRALEHGLAFEPHARFASMDSLLAALERWRRRSLPGSRTAWTIFGLLVIAALAVFLVGTQPDHRQRPTSSTPELAAAGLQSLAVDFGGWSARLRDAHLDFVAAARARAELVTLMQTARTRDARAGFPDLALLLRGDMALRSRWFGARHAFDAALGSALIGRIPTHALVFGEQTHPFVQFNLAAMQLEHARLPLGQGQLARTRAIGERYQRDWGQQQASYRPDTLTQQKFLDEAQIKDESDRTFRAALTTAQRSVLAVAGGERVLTWDQAGPASMLAEVTIPVALSNQDLAQLPQVLRRHALALLALPIDPSAHELQSVFDKMAASAAPQVLAMRHGQLVIRVEDALAFGRIMQRTRAALLALLPAQHAARPGLSAGTNIPVFYLQDGPNVEERSAPSPAEPKKAGPSIEMRVPQ